jgi:outer membrane protein insertion porin family
MTVAGSMLRILLVVSLGTTPASATEPPPSPRFVLERWALEGDSLLVAEDVLPLLPGEPGDTLSPEAGERAARLLESRLIEGGYWTARVTPRVRPEGASRDSAPGSPERAVLALAIESEAPVMVGEIAVRGNFHLTREEILSRMDVRPGRPFDVGVFTKDVARVLRAYSERGFPRARLYPSRFRRTEDGRLGVDLRLGEGPRGEIESVRVFGAEQTSDAVVARIAGVRPGDRWDVRKIERMASRLRREGLFTTVGEPRVVRGGRDNRLGVEIEVREGPSGSIFGVLGYNPDPAGGGYLVGLVDVSLRNILGTARRASLRFERQAGDVQDLSFRFREPWILGTPLSVEGGVAQAKRDTLFSRTDLDAALAVPIGDHATVRIAAERRDSSFDDALGDRIHETATGGSVGLSTDLRDRRVNPSRGWRAETLVGYRSTESDERRTRVETGGQVLLPLGRRWIVSEEVGARGVWSTGSEVPLYDQFFLGGTNTLRGYREEQFHGERVWWIRSEMRYRLSIRSRMYLFTDVGGYDFETATPEGRRRVRDTLVGGGFGLSLETRASGLVKLELALGRGDGFSDAKVHAGLEREF